MRAARSDSDPSRRWCRARAASPTVQVVAALCALLALQERAAAQEAVWVAAPADQLETWYAQARAALEAEGVLVSEAGAAGASCSVEGARDAARAHGAALGLCVDVARGAAGAPAVTISLMRADGAAGEGSAEAPDGALAAAVRDAYRKAELALELGRAGLLRVRTMPQGALVSIDGEPAGHAPLERKLAPGGHALSLALDGFAGARRQVQVARGQAVELEVKLERLATHGPVVHTETSPLNYVFGGALLAGAVPALAISLAALADDGDCTGERSASGACQERVHFGARSAVLLGIGGAALLSGAYLLLAAPIEVEVRAGAQAAYVRLGARL